MQKKLIYSIITLAALPLIWGSIAILPFSSPVGDSFNALALTVFSLAGMPDDVGLGIIAYYYALYFLLSLLFLILSLGLLGFMLKKWKLALLSLLVILLPPLAVFIHGQVITIQYDERKHAISEQYQDTFVDLYEVDWIDIEGSVDQVYDGNLIVRFLIRRLPELSSNYTLEFSLRDYEILAYLNSNNLIEMTKVNSGWQYHFQQGQYPEPKYKLYRYETNPSSQKVELPTNILSFYFPASRKDAEAARELTVTIRDNDPKSTNYNQIVYERHIPVKIVTTAQ